jgi:putative DNA primase/helicase
MMHITLFRSIRDREIIRQQREWSEITERALAPKLYASKDEMPLIKLATFGDTRSRGGFLRHEKNILGVTGIEADYDAGEVGALAAAEALHAHRIKSVVYTTPSHTDAAPRWRVLAPLFVPVRAGDRAALVARLNGILDGVLADESFVPAQTFYWGAVEGAPYVAHVVDGDFIDQREDLDRGAVLPVRVAPARTTDDSDSSIEVFTEGGRNRGLFVHAARMRRIGMPEAEILPALLAANDNRCDPPLPESDVRTIAGSAGRYPAPAAASLEPATPAAPAPASDSAVAVELCVDEALSEISMGRALAACTAGHLCYVGAWGWLVRNGHRWQRDDRMLVFSKAKAVCGIAATHAPTVPMRKKISSAASVAAVVSLARSEHNIIAQTHEFDRHRWELNTPGGVVDLRAGVMRPHSPDDLFTHSTNVAPDFAAQPTRWLAFLRQVFKRDSTADTDEMVEYVRRLRGYCLTGEVDEQVFAFFSGTGANGKSTLLDTVLAIMGDYALKLPAETLMQSRGDRHPTEIAQLAGVRLAVSNEVAEGVHWNEARLKELTGDDVMRGRLMRQDFFTFPITHKHLIAGNHRPVLRVVDQGFTRRLHLVEFRHTFSGRDRDASLLATLKAEGPAILAWMIGGAKDRYASRLTKPNEIEVASRNYIDQMDDIGLWLAECCVHVPGVRSGGTPSSLLWRSYRDWVRGRGGEPMSNKRLSPLLESRGFVRVVDQHTKGTSFAGLSLLTGELERVNNAVAAEAERARPRPAPDRPSSGWPQD